MTPICHAREGGPRSLFPSPLEEEGTRAEAKPSESG